MEKEDYVTSTASNSEETFSQTYDDDNVSSSWSNLNLQDAEMDSPTIEELIRRNVKLIEARIIRIMNWRLQERKKNTRDGLCLGDYLETQVKEKEDIITALPESAKAELELFVRTIAFRYNKVLYHNFEHASHVTACVNEFVTLFQYRSRESFSLSEFTPSSSMTSSSSLTTQHDPSNADIFASSNPVVHLAMVISALIHDVEHQGIGNKQLVEEKTPLAIKYKGKSVAENNSFEVALGLFYQDDFQNLRNCIFGEDELSVTKKNKTEIETYKSLFHQISHDIILATDISCPIRMKQGKLKWKLAFEDVSYKDAYENCSGEHVTNNIPRRASFPRRIIGNTHRQRWSSKPKDSMPTEFIADPFPDQTKLPRHVRSRELSWSSALNMSVSTEIVCPLCGSKSVRCEAFQCTSYTRLSAMLEQIIQAADVGHTMQSWPVFIKWNEKLYNELWVANLQGRGPDCRGQWFDGQISFIDNYIVPLAERLKRCGMFGSQGSLFYENAIVNQQRWILEGRDICRQMYENASKLFGTTIQ